MEVQLERRNKLEPNRGKRQRSTFTFSTLFTKLIEMYGQPSRCEYYLALLRHESTYQLPNSFADSYPISCCRSQVSYIGLRTVTVQYGVDGTVVRVPYPCRSGSSQPLRRTVDGTVIDRPIPSKVRPSTVLDGIRRVTRTNLIFLCW